MRDFAAIDFETANGNRSSVCSVGIVIVRSGKITQKIHKLIRPTPHFYSGFCTQVHGMTLRDTSGSPSFEEVWNEIAPAVDGLPLVAHNAVFDEGCLRSAHKAYDMEYPNYQFYCTLVASRRIHKCLPNHRLNTVAAECGYDLVNHHHALADAEACAVIAMQIL